MRRLARRPLTLLALMGTTWCLAASGGAQTSLRPRGSVSHSGTLSVRGAASEPASARVTSGGNLSVQVMGLAEACRGYATAAPDVIVHHEEPGATLRFAVRGRGGDTTLIVHTPDDRWLCDDDGGGGVDPLVLDEAPVAGQYDVWVGSYRAGEYHAATLSVGPS